MSLEHSIQRKRRPHRSRVFAPLAYTTNEFCKLTGISRASAYRLMRAGTLKFVRLGARSRRIPAAELARLLETEPEEETRAPRWS